VSNPVVRYAPSPTGRLHLGNARPMLLNWLFSQARSGDYILRLDDTDTARSTEEFARGIEEDLSWLGVTPAARVRQSDRTALYDQAREKLIAAGRLYPAYETEDELAEQARLTAHLLAGVMRYIAGHIMEGGLPAGELVERTRQRLGALLPKLAAHGPSENDPTGAPRE
jgi:glutamyl/glutaminyl-tRNA synthetase